MDQHKSKSIAVQLFIFAQILIFALLVGFNSLPIWREVITIGAFIFNGLSFAMWVSEWHEE